MAFCDDPRVANTNLCRIYRKEITPSGFGAVIGGAVKAVAGSVAGSLLPNGGGSNMPVTTAPAGGGFAPTAGSSGPTIGGVLTGVATAIGGAIAAQIPAPPPLGTGRLLGTPQIQTGISGVPALSGNCGCSCSNKTRAGGCDGRTVTLDSGQVVPGEYADLVNIFGTRCDDPCYPRLLHQQGRDVCRPARKKPRMNPFNPSAAKRATRRLTALNKQTKRLQTALKKICR